MRFLRRKRVVIPAIVGVLALVGAGAVYAYFTSTGTGTGSAQVGSTKALTITQIGAGYDSLISSTAADPYIEDQTLGGDGPSEIGNDITLANTGYQQLVSAVLAVRNWGPAIPEAQIALYISKTVDGSVTFPVQTFDIPAANPDGSPTVDDLTFNVASQDVLVGGGAEDNEFQYGFIFEDPYGSVPADPHGESNLNPALSSSAFDLSVGTDTSPGSIWMNDSYGDNGDFPYTNAGCTTNDSLPTVGFAQVVTEACPALETGAYGLPAQVVAGNADIPAVEFNVVGGVIPSLYPGGPAQPVDFAITNPNAGNVGVQSVTFMVSGITGVQMPTEAGQLTCQPSWFTPLVQPTSPTNVEVPPGTTVYSPSGGSITLEDLLPVGTPADNQDSCEGATVNLSFSST